MVKWAINVRNKKQSLLCMSIYIYNYQVLIVIKVGKIILKIECIKLYKNAAYFFPPDI